MPASPSSPTVAALRAANASPSPLLRYLACAACATLLLAVWPTTAASSNMLLHVLMMSVAAPLAVAAVRGLRRRNWHTRPPQLWLAALLQLAVFFYWHSPVGMMLAMHSASGELLLQGSLLGVACLFWWCIAGLDAKHSWHAITTLLVTGKLFCLVAVILTFAPRPLYHAMTLADQQLAGLIMITLCPMTYVASALWLCRRWLLGVGMRPAPAHGSASCN